MYIVCAVMYITFPPSKLLIPTAVIALAASHGKRAFGTIHPSFALVLERSDYPIDVSVPRACHEGGGRVKIWNDIDSSG